MLVEQTVKIRRLFQWHFNFLNVACLEWGFMNNCAQIVFERRVPRFYRARVVQDLLRSYHLTKVLEREDALYGSTMDERGTMGGSGSEAAPIPEPSARQERPKPPPNEHEELSSSSSSTTGTGNFPGSIPGRSSTGNSMAHAAFDSTKGRSYLDADRFDYDGDDVFDVLLDAQQLRHRLGGSMLQDEEDQQDAGETVEQNSSSAVSGATPPSPRRLRLDRLYDLHRQPEPANEIIFQGLSAAVNRGITVKFVEIGVFQGRLSYHVLQTCPFVEYYGVDPYQFENDDFEFQGLFTDRLEGTDLVDKNATFVRANGDEGTTATVKESGTKRTNREAWAEQLDEWSGEEERKRFVDTAVSTEGDGGVDPGNAPGSTVDKSPGASGVDKSQFEEALLEARDGARQKIGFFANRARLLETTSENAARQFDDESVDFVFVDGDHSYSATFDDISWWWPKVRRGGMIGGHDFGSNQQVTRAVMDWVGQELVRGCGMMLWSSRNGTRRGDREVHDVGLGRGGWVVMSTSGM